MTDETTDVSKSSDELPNLRTFRQDVVDTLKSEDVSVATVAIQEQARRYREVETTEKEIRTSKVLVTSIGILVFLGAVALAYVIFLREAAPTQIPTPTQTLLTSLLPAETRTLFDVTNKEEVVVYRELSLRVSGAGLSPNTLEEIIPIKTNLGDTSAHYLSTEEFFQSIGVKVPERLIRFLDKRFMFGIYALRTTSAFLLLKPTSFGPVFAELLAWEKESPYLFYPLFTAKNLSQKTQIAWQDRIIRNIDTRIATNSKGEVLMIYGFLPSKEELVIAADIDTFTEVLQRSQSPKPVSQ